MRIQMEGNSFAVNMEKLILDLWFLSSVRGPNKSVRMSSTLSKYYPHNLASIFLLQVLLVDGNNVPISNKVISIFAHAANYVFHATTNEQGLAEFSINTTNIFGTQLFITVSMKGK